MGLFEETARMGLGALGGIGTLGGQAAYYSAQQQMDAGLGFGAHQAMAAQQSQAAAGLGQARQQQSPINRHLAEPNINTMKRAEVVNESERMEQLKLEERKARSE